MSSGLASFRRSFYVISTFARRSFHRLTLDITAQSCSPFSMSSYNLLSSAMLKILDEVDGTIFISPLLEITVGELSKGDLTKVEMLGEGAVGVMLC